MTGVDTPFFSVVIPVYNRARVFAMAVQSVLDQTEQDFEIVVVDDGSRDDPKAALDRYSDSRIRYIRQENKGGGAARNTGIDLARGRFIAFLDSDDWFLPMHLATMRQMLEGTEGIAGYAKMIVDRGKGRTFIKPPRAIRPDEHIATYLLCDRGFIPTTTLVVGAAMARQVRYSETLPYAQDTDFAIRLFLAGCKFVMSEEPAAVWRDAFNPNRASAGRKGAQLIGWLEILRPQIPEEAYRGGRGWTVAKGVVTTSFFRALGLYLGAVIRGCYRPKLAGIVFLQIFFSDRLYRWIADTFVARYRGAVWARADEIAAQPNGIVR